jgi:hypothetical protein
MRLGVGFDPWWGAFEGCVGMGGLRDQVDGAFARINPLVEEGRTDELRDLCQAWLHQGGALACVLCVAYRRESWEVRWRGALPGMVRFVGSRRRIWQIFCNDAFERVFASAQEFAERVLERQVCPSFLVGSLLSAEDHEAFGEALAATAFGLEAPDEHGFFLRPLTVVKVRARGGGGGGYGEDRVVDDDGDGGDGGDGGGGGVVGGGTDTVRYDRDDDASPLLITVGTARRFFVAECKALFA